MGQPEGGAAVDPGANGPVDEGEAASPPARRIAVVPHTHWDREWYEPFQTFRLKLVRLVDGLLDQMEQDSSYSPLPPRRPAGR